MLAINVVIYS